MADLPDRLRPLVRVRVLIPDVIHVHADILEKPVPVTDASGSCTAKCVIDIRSHPAAQELAPVLFNVLTEVTPGLPPDVAGGSERNVQQVVTVDRKLFLNALFERPDIIEHVKPVLEGQIVVLVTDLFIIDQALLFLLLDAEILAPLIKRTVC